jgi:DNA-directed RNA polymerase specialized sigma24 family protein
VKEENPELVKSNEKSTLQSHSTQYAELNRAISAVLKKNDDNVLSLYLLIASQLKQYNLQDSYNAAFILNECYVRGVRAIDQGKSISSPIAWLRLTSRNVIRELGRETLKAKGLEKSMRQPDDAVHRTASSNDPVLLSDTNPNSKDADSLDKEIAVEERTTNIELGTDTEESNRFLDNIALAIADRNALIINRQTSTDRLKNDTRKILDDLAEVVSTL